MTVGEAEPYYEFYYESENKKIKEIMLMFTARNIESTRLARNGKPHDIKRYLNSLKGSKEEKENNIDEQFNGVNFGE